jgi:hypothetical protein
MLLCICIFDPVWPLALTANRSYSDLCRVQVILMLSELTPKDAANEMHETVYEYQEWSVLSDWQPMAQPGRYGALWFMCDV